MELHVSHISYTKYHRNILRDVSVSFSPGLYYLIGSNGSGKTTLLRALTRQIDYQGSISLGQTDISEYSAKQLARYIALVPQQLQVPVALTVTDFVLLGRYPWLDWLGNYKPADRDIVQQHLQHLDIADLHDRRLDEISGGELQKVYLCRALTQETPIILLDEPGQSLDPKSREFLYEMLEVLATNGKTIICATHDLLSLQNPASNIIGLRDGQLVLEQKGGDIQQLLFDKVYI